MLHINLDTTDGATLINIQYGVCFGAIFAHSLVTQQVTGGGYFTSLAIDPMYIISVLLLIVYFFSDWLATNFKRRSIQFSAPRLFFSSLWIWFLGYVVLLSNSEGALKFVVLSAYAGSAAAYHIVSYSRGTYGTDGPRAIVGGVLQCPVLVVALFVMQNGVIGMAGLIPSPSEDLYSAAVVVMIVFKLVDLIILSPWIRSGSSEMVS